MWQLLTRLFLMENAIERLHHKIFTAKNNKVHENDNHADISAHASQLDIYVSYMKICFQKLFV